MIQQPTQQPIMQQPICDSASQCSGNGNEHSWLGHGVAVSKAFAKSLIPTEDPHLGFNSRKAVEDLVRLATATILPSSSILFMVKDMANAWTGSGLPGPDAKPELPQTSKEIREEAQEQEPGSKDVPLQQTSTARYQGSQGTKGLLALGTLASSFQYANSKQINDAETLGKIGRHSDYPLDGTYQQTADIVVTNGHHRIPGAFSGEYDGQCHTISGLSDCFVDTLQGSIRNLDFTGANINRAKMNEWEATGLAACVVDVTGTVSNIRAEDVRIVVTQGYRARVGIGGGVVKGTVDSITAVDSHVALSGYQANAAIGGGYVTGTGTVANTMAVNSHVTLSGKGLLTNAGIGGGYVEGTVANTTAVNSHVTTKRQEDFAGIGGGVVKGTVVKTTAVKSSVETSGKFANAGIGGGEVFGTVDKTTAVDSHVTTRGEYANAGIGAGLVKYGTVANTMAVNSNAKTWGRGSKANIGVGYIEGHATVTNTKAVSIGSISNDQLFCQNADPRVLTANCSSITELQDALDLSFCLVNADTVSTNSANSTNSRSASSVINTVITTGVLAAAGWYAGLGIVGYSSYQWITGYRDGLRGQELAMRPLTRIKELVQCN
ncbi:hypothetical protein J7438_24345 [Thalassotalea sp. G20_0]|uniref:hypothetical protein n=1 Tax=Thalassotalea sp. G20_0 TaxID=2821093 RepID=UPI001ADCBFCF|nr:hypothetical protein [Thalassotalea sp. G20_0]MBO9497192.1 hypothetical protein [Thalassotalea sp. G20_0]